MDYKNLGLTGLNVSVLCLGTMQFGWTADEGLSMHIMSTAFDEGINFFDTADIYSRWVDGNPGGVSERIIGKWWKEKKIPRDKIILATKVRGNMGGGKDDEGLSEAHIMKSVEKSLKRLQTDYIDLYQAHWPDDATPIEETLVAFDRLVKEGKVRYIGASNYTAWQFMQSLWISDRSNITRFDSLQPHYNLIHRAEFERELAQVCKTYHIGVIPYSPLAGGFLTGKYRRNLIPHSARAEGVKKNFTEKNWTLLDYMDTLAKERGTTLTQISLAWLLSNPVITSPIIGTNTVEQLKENLSAINLKLTTTENDNLDRLSAWEGNEE